MVSEEEEAEEGGTVEVVRSFGSFARRSFARWFVFDVLAPNDTGQGYQTCVIL